MKFKNYEENILFWKLDFSTIVFLFFVDFIRDPQTGVLKPWSFMALGPIFTHLIVKPTMGSSSSSLLHSFPASTKTKSFLSFAQTSLLCMSKKSSPRWKTNHTNLFSSFLASYWHHFQRIWVVLILFSKLFFLIETSRGKPFLSSWYLEFFWPRRTSFSCMQGVYRRAPLFFSKYWVFEMGFHGVFM